ncbi:MAG: RDD family protein [Cyclobacteriaceae bacterium]
MMEYPSLVKRIQAVVIDFLLILVLFSVASLLFNSLGEVADGVRIGVLVFCFVLYEPLFVSQMGGTLGHYLLGLRVKQHDAPADNISFLSALGRIIIKGALGWISFLTISSNSEKRALHDIVSGSLVCHK